MFKPVKVVKSKPPKARREKSSEEIEKIESDTTSAALKKVNEFDLAEQMVPHFVRGLSWSAIGKQFDPPIPPAKVQRILRDFYNKHHDEKSEMFRERTLAQLQRLTEALTESAFGYTDDNGRWNPPSVEHIKALQTNITLLAKMVNLFAPVEVKHTHVINEVLNVVSNVVTVDQFRQILSSLASLSSEGEVGPITGGSSGAPPLGLPG